MLTSVVIAVRLATSPAAAPPMPSATIIANPVSSKRSGISPLGKTGHERVEGSSDPGDQIMVLVLAVAPCLCGRAPRSPPEQEGRRAGQGRFFVEGAGVRRGMGIGSVSSLNFAIGSPSASGVVSPGRSLR